MPTISSIVINDKVLKMNRALDIENRVEYPTDTRTFTAPSDGVFSWATQSNFGTCRIYVNDVQIGLGTGGASTKYNGFTFPLQKGDVVTCSSGNSNVSFDLIFYPYK